MTVCPNACPRLGSYRRLRLASGVAARFLMPWARPYESPTAASGDIAQLLDVDVQERPGVVVLVAADHLTGANVDVR